MFLINKLYHILNINLPLFVKWNYYWILIIYIVLLYYEQYECQTIMNVNVTSTIFNESEEDKSIIMNETICAHFNVSDGKSFNIYDRDNYSQGLEDIHNTNFHELFYSVNIKIGCVVRICVINFLNPNNAIRKRECNTLTNSTALDYNKYFYLVTTRCSCQEPIDNCDIEKCEKIILNENECVRLFVETECRECRFNSISLSIDESFIPTNGFSTESFVIRNGCKLFIQSIGKQTQSPDFIYDGIHSNIQLSYVLKPKPSKFTCTCDLKYENNTNSQDVTSENISTNYSSGLNPIIIILSSAIPILLLSLIVTIILLLKRRYFNQNNFKTHEIQLQDKINSNIIESFEHGTIKNSNASFEDDDDDGTILHYVSIGYTNALSQPYQSRFEVSRKNITIGKILEKGNFGVVSCGILKQNDGSTIDVAIKESKSSSNPTYFISLLDEIKVLSFIGTHPNIVSLIGACTQDLKNRDALLLLELCTEGSLKNYLKKHQKIIQQTITTQDNLISNENGYASFDSVSSTSQHVPTATVTIPAEYFILLIKWAKEIANGMNFLGQKKVVHVDLAARNVLLTSTLIAKISDFGLSKRLHEVGTYVKIGEEYPLPIRWMSMESLIDQRFTSASDVWSYGITLWEIFSFGQNPYKNIPPMNYNQLVTFLNNDERLQKPLHASNKIYNEMYKCWLRNPENRPSFIELHEFFQDLLNEMTAETI